MMDVSFKRLVIFIHSMGGGGAERVTANLANHWAGKGWGVTVVTLAPSQCDCYELHPTVKRIALNLSGRSGNVVVGLLQNLGRIVALRRVLRQTQPDVALGMMDKTNVLLALASWGSGEIRTVGSERTYPPQYPLGAVWELLRRHSYSGLDAIVAQTAEGATWIRNHTRARRVVVIHNPVNFPLRDQSPRLLVGNVCCSTRYLLLAVGRLTVEKQFSLLIDCFKSLAASHPEWSLVILGEGPLSSVLRAQVKAVGLDGRIFLPGRSGNMGDWYERADLFVMSSRFEGFPNALVEALAHGVPAVSFDCDTGPRDIIRSEVDGLLVPPNDETKMTAALGRLMGAADLRARFAERAVEARERFSIDKIAEKWEELFEKVAA